MSELVRRLREEAYNWESEVLTEAADEIERLRAVLRDARQTLSTEYDEPQAARDKAYLIIDAALAGKGES